MADLPRRTLGRTGVEVTTLGFGAMELRGVPRGPEVSDETAEQVLHAVLDAGINFIDTSPDYGRSEELIGRFIADRRLEGWLRRRGLRAARGSRAHLQRRQRARRGGAEPAPHEH